MGKEITEGILAEIGKDPDLYRMDSHGTWYLLKHKVIAHFRCSWGTAYKLEAILNEEWNTKTVKALPTTP